MDGRSVWPDSFERARDALAAIDDGKPIRLVPTTSFLLLPVTVEGEDLPPGFQFAREKARALAQWPEALAGGAAPSVQEPPPAEWPEVGELAPRVPRDERKRRAVGPQPAAVPDDDHRLAAADDRGASAARAARQGRARTGGLRRRDRAPHHRLGRLAGADGPRRARPRRVRAHRHGRVLRRADGRLPHHAQRLGPLLREPMRPRPDPGRAADHPRADDRRRVADRAGARPTSR